MRSVERRLETLDSEIGDLTAKIEVAQEDWLTAQNAQEKANLEKVYEDLKEDKQLLNTRRARLEDKLPSSGEHVVQLSLQIQPQQLWRQVLRRDCQTPGQSNTKRVDVQSVLCLHRTYCTA